MKIKELIQFKNWADEVYIEYIEGLTDTQFIEVVPTINKSIKQIIFHILSSYWGEYHLMTDRNWEDEPSFDELNREQIISRIRELNNKILDFADNSTLDQPITYNEEGYEKPIKTSAEIILFNFVEHSSYHRGQLALMLKYHGIESVKQTNYNPYIWELSQQ